MEVTLLGKAPALVALDVIGGRRTAVRMRANEVRIASVALPLESTCRVMLQTTGLVGTTRIVRLES